MTNNPWDPVRTPGGSSGGSAAVVAAGMAFLEDDAAIPFAELLEDVTGGF